ncbi:hypothetical protein ACIBG8_14715 [Nonomuraea sp. NPDC050556]|uniref:hypothetical protein n=1 Tax=Nonomuraea sp. NPDC050556 TaxID=3364369 RepID=UPI0037A5053F
MPDVLIWLLLAFAGAAVQRASDVIFGESIERVIYSTITRRRMRTSLAGEWHSAYEYRSDDDGAIHTDEHTFEVSQRGRRVVMKDPGGPGRSRMHVRGTLSHGGVFSGEWEELALSGRQYSGVVQLLLSRTRNEMRGQWVGFTRTDLVQNGSWTIRKA